MERLLVSTICRAAHVNIRRNSARPLAKLPDRFPKLEVLVLLFNNFTDGALDHVVRDFQIYARSIYAAA